MKSKIHCILSLLTMVSLLFLGSCEKEGTKIPLIAFSPETIKVSFEGGDFSVAYQIENPIEEAEITVDCDADWITNFNTETKGQIHFSVSENNLPESREAVVKVNYPTIAPVSIFIVKQMIGKPNPFTIETPSVTYTSMKLSIIPEDKDMQYLYFISPTDVMSKFLDDESLFADDLVFFQDAADKYGVPVSETIRDYVLSGDMIDMDISELYPGTSYTIYVYGIDVNTVERLTDIIKYEIETEAVQVVEAKFDIDVQINGLSVDITYTPKNYDGYYCWGISTNVDESMTKKELTDAFMDNWMNMYNMYKTWYGFTNEAILEQLCSTSTNTFSNELDASTLYVTIAAAVNEEALICSEISYEFFTTGEVELSDNIITIDVTDIKSRSAVITINTTNDDTYAAMVVASERVEGWSEEDIINAVISNSKPFSGDFSEKVKPLTPETEYIVYAVGCASGTATTQLFSKSFTTPEAVLADMTVKVEYGGYADVMAIANLDESYAKFAKNNYAFIAFNLSSKPAGYPIYWAFFEANVINNPEVTEDDIINALTQQKPSESPYEIGFREYGHNIIVCAIGEDEYGNLSPLYKGESLEITKDGVMDPAEWLKRYPWPYNDSEEAETSIIRASNKITNIKAESCLLNKVNIHRHVAKKHYNVSSEKRFIWKVPVNKEEIMHKSNSSMVVNHVRKIKK